MTQHTQKIINLIKKLHPLQRNANSEGVDKAFEIIKKTHLNKSKIHNYKSGLKIEDWEVPKRWKLKYSYIKDHKGNIITSSKINTLFVAPYSESIEGWFTKKEIGEHLFTRKEKSDCYLLEHRNTYDYNLNDWRITLPFSLWERMTDKKYYVKIDVEWTNGNMKVLECILPGKKKDIICFNAHIDELCNDDLSGCALGVEIFKYLSKIKNRKYTYQLILAPELFGFLYYVYFNKNKVAKTMGMLNLEQVGAGKEWVLKKSITEESIMDMVLESSFNSTKIKYNFKSFFDGYMNDEKIFSWPTMNIPSVAIQRYPFNEYHTSEDTPKIIKSKYIDESYKVCLNFVNILENNYIPAYKNFLPPWLTKRNLYVDYYQDKKNHQKYNNDILYLINGKNSILDISKKVKLDFFDTLLYINKLLNKKIIKKN